MDLGKIDHVGEAEKPAEMELTDPKTGGIVLSSVDNSPVVLFVVGNDSERYRRKQREIIDRRGDAIARGIPFTAEAQEQEALELAVISVTGWRGVTEDGKPAEFTPEKIRGVFQRVPAWREQTAAFAARRSNFIKG